MGWYDSAWAYRAAVTIDNSGAAGTVDVEIVVPSDWDHFWGAVQADGDDIHVTDADGQTLLSYALSGWDYANKTVTIQIDALTIPATAGMYLVWVYYGNDAATDDSVAVTITAAVSGYIEQGVPSTHLVSVQPESPGSTRPRAQLQKTSSEQLAVWWDVTALLERRARAHAGRMSYEEMYGARVQITTGGTPQASMVDNTLQRFVEANGRSYLRFWLKAGTDATTYTVELTLVTRVPTTTTYRTLEPRAMLRVQDVDEA